MMAYKEGNTIADLEVLTNPYADQSNAMEVIGLSKLGDCQPTYYASMPNCMCRMVRCWVP